MAYGSDAKDREVPGAEGCRPAEFSQRTFATVSSPMTLSASIEPLKAAFNADADKVRILLLTSPT